MVTKNRQNRDHFRDSNTPPRVNFFDFFSANMFSWFFPRFIYVQFGHTVPVDLKIRAQKWLYPTNLTEPSRS